MSGPTSEIEAALAFDEERRAYYREMADATEREMRAAELLEARWIGRQKGAGVRWALALGVERRLAAVCGVLALSASRSARLAAAAIIGRSLTRTARAA